MCLLSDVVPSRVCGEARRDLAKEVSAIIATDAVRTVEPLVISPGAVFLDALPDVQTPALVYDLVGLRRSLQILVEDIANVPGAELNLALKSCHTPALLRFIAHHDIGADVASMGEFELARLCDFPRITATGPSFGVEDAERLQALGVLLDASSYDQLDEVCRAHPGTAVGLRLRVPLPAEIEDDATTFGAHSRFGLLATDERIHTLLADTGCSLARIHTHTGQMTPEHLVYKARYLLAVAKAFPDLDTIDFGGGFFSLYTSRRRAIGALTTVGRLVEEWREQTGRNMRLQFEPGGAILAPHGFLTTTVLSVEQSHPEFNADIATVDSSAWNLAPWHRPQVLHLPHPEATRPTRPTLLAGNTLYENDFFGTDVRGVRTVFELPGCAAGDTLLLTASGAYTMTNARMFNRLPLPREYTFDGDTLQEVT